MNSRWCIVWDKKQIVFFINNNLYKNQTKENDHGTIITDAEASWKMGHDFSSRNFEVVDVDERRSILLM